MATLNIRSPKKWKWTDRNLDMHIHRVDSNVLTHKKPFFSEQWTFFFSLQSKCLSKEEVIQRCDDMKETVKPYDTLRMLLFQWRTDRKLFYSFGETLLFICRKKKPPPVLPLVRLSSMALAETPSIRQSRRRQNVQTLPIFWMWRMCLVVKR